MSFMEWWDGFWATYNTVIFSIGVNAMLALSIYVTLSCGLLSLANAAFMGIGAYTASLITMQTGLPFPVALAAGGATAGTGGAGDRDSDLAPVRGLPGDGDTGLW